MRVFGFAICLSLFLTFSPSCWADGCFLPPEDYRGKSLREPAQRAVIVHAESKQSLILFVDYQGQAKQFAWVIPSPTKPEVDTSDSKIFSEVVDYYYQQEVAAWKKNRNRRFDGAGGLGSGPEKPVTVHSTRSIGPYEMAVVSATDAGGLKDWLKKNKYGVPDGFEPVLDKYVAEKWFFTAVKVKVKTGKATLKPIRLDFESKEPVFPLRISSANHGVTKVLLYVVQPASARFVNSDSHYSTESFDFRNLGKQCPRLKKLRPALDWSKMKMERIEFSVPRQVMKYHDDKSIVPKDFAMAAGMAEAWISKDREELQWAKANLYVGNRLDANSSNTLSSIQRSKLKEIGQELGRPFFAALRKEIMMGAQKRFDENCTPAINILGAFGDDSRDSIECLTKVAMSQKHGNAAVNALMAMGSHPSRKALVAIAKSSSNHNVSAWFRYVYSLRRNEIANAEKKEACRNLVEMLSKKLAAGDAAKQGMAVLKSLSGENHGEDWNAWKKWISRQR